MEKAFNEQTLLEKKCSLLEDQYKQLTQNTDLSIPEDFDIPELSSLRIENSKLKYRIDILKKSIEEENKLQLKLNLNPTHSKDSNELMNGNNSKEMTQNSKGMKSILHEIRQLFQTAIRESFPKLNNVPLLVTPSDHADYQCNSALPLSKFIGDKRLSPRDVANAIIEHLPQNEMISSVVVAGPGFINITLNKDYVCNSVRDIVINGVRVNGLKESNSRERIVIDYSAPNIAKEMHVGHLRSTIIGDSIARLFEFVGYDVLRVNHIGDWGTQFGMLLAHLIELYPNYLTNPPPIADLQAFYKESKKRFDEDPEFKKRAYNTTVRLQAKEPDMITAWKQICDISRKEFQEVYRILDISKDLIERGESYYHELMVQVVKDLEQKQLLIEDEGRKVFFTSDKSLPPMTIVKSDGGFTYDTSDLATLRQRVEEEKASRIIYTVDAGQSQHFQILFNCAALAGYYDPKKVRVDHLAFGVVLGEDKKKFKTRSGDTVRLKSLIEEGLERALAKLIEKGRDKVLTPEELKAAQEAVAIGCIKYADLSHDRNHEYVFSFDRMLDDRGNTAVYLLYALTRIRSIIRNAKLTQSIEDIAKSSPKLDLDHPREYKLSKFILKFAEIILQIVDDLFLHTLCKYLFELSVVFSEFYDQCYCIEKITTESGETIKVNTNRIILCEATARVIETGLQLLGIKSVEKM